MANRDYILRLIEQAAAVLRLVLSRLGKRGAPRDEISRELRRAAHLGGLDLDLLHLFDGPTLVQAVAPGGEPEAARTWLAAETLYLDGLAAEEAGSEDEARHAYAKARLLYGLLQPSVVLPTGFAGARDRIADIEDRLAALG